MCFLRATYRGILLLAFVAAAAVSVAVNVNIVAADPCTAQLGYSSVPTTQYYYNSNVGITIPVSASCSAVSGQLYAVENAYDTSVNKDLGSVNTVLSSHQNAYYQNPYQYGNCYQNPYCYYPGYNYNNRPCQATGNTSTVQCSGFLYDNSNECIELAVPIDNAYWAETRIYQYYTLVNLPSYYALTRSWVTVTGQMSRGYSILPSSTTCSPNYITVTSISP